MSDELISRYERYIAGARLPALRDVQRRLRQQREAAIAEAAERCGRSVVNERLTALVCAVDGAVVAALVDEHQDPRAAARSTIIDVVDVVAPANSRY